jgi:two-component system, OmpR family, sensor histidine kinase CiaH
VFAPIGRRLALVNAVVITVLVAVVGVSALLVLRDRIAQQTHDTLVERAGIAGASWTSYLASGQPIPNAAIAASAPEQVVDADDATGNDLLESGDTVLLGFDRNGVLAANPRGLNLAGFSTTDSVGLALKGAASTRRLNLKESGTVDVYTVPLRSNGQIVGVVQAIQGQREHDQTMRLLALVLAGSAGLGVLLAAPAGLFLARRAMRPIDLAFERQRTFVADAAHELRAPLTVLRANAELIERIPDLSPSELQSEVGGMVQEIDEMSRLVSDLLDLARADASRLVVETSRVELAGVVRDAIQPMEALAVGAGVALTIEAGESVFVEADPGRIRQLTRALVDNALVYTASGGEVHVSVARRNRSAIVTVRDTGIGIPPEEQANVFRRFYRTDHARARSAGGAGLGLSIAHAIVVAHGGKISLESAAGCGTVIRIELPAIQ